MLNSTLQWGRCRTWPAQGDPNPTLSLNPTAYDFKPPKVYAWNVGVQRKVWRNLIFDLAYVGSSRRTCCGGSR